MADPQLQSLQRRVKYLHLLQTLQSSRAIAELPRILLGCERGNVRYARLGLIKWLKYSPRKALRGKLPVRYQGLTLRFAVNVDFSFFFLFRKERLYKQHLTSHYYMNKLLRKKL